MPALALLGFGGGLLHVLNHALFKGSLSGGRAVLHGRRDARIDHLGGLLKRNALGRGRLPIGRPPPFRACRAQRPS